jgi:hypothetical protein
MGEGCFERAISAIGKVQVADSARPGQIEVQSCSKRGLRVAQAGKSWEDRYYTRHGMRAGLRKREGGILCIRRRWESCDVASMELLVRRGPHHWLERRQGSAVRVHSTVKTAKIASETAVHGDQNLKTVLYL